MEGASQAGPVSDLEVRIGRMAYLVQGDDIISELPLPGRELVEEIPDAMTEDQFTALVDRGIADARQGISRERYSAGILGGAMLASSTLIGAVLISEAAQAPELTGAIGNGFGALFCGFVGALSIRWIYRAGTGSGGYAKSNFDTVDRLELFKQQNITVTA